MRITIVGGGNIGTLLAVHCAEKQHEVTVFTSAPEMYNGHLDIVDENGKTIHEGNILLATSDPESAFAGSELILVTYPPMLMHHTAELVYSFTDAGTIIGVVPGNGGSECAFRKCIERGNPFFGMERVPAICRLVQKGRTVRAVGYRNELHIAALPGSKAKQCAELTGRILDMKTAVIPNYLNLTMTPSNPILHTARLRTIFRDWHDGVTYERVPLFYEEWDDASSELLIACDNEVQEICRALPALQLQYVKSLREHYESPTAALMTKKISSIEAFKGLTTPTVKTEKGLIPDLHSRYFTSDFSYGLAIIQQIAGFAGVETPFMDEIMEWYDSISVEKNAFHYADYGIVNFRDFSDFYRM